MLALSLKIQLQCTAAQNGDSFCMIYDKSYNMGCELHSLSVRTVPRSDRHQQTPFAQSMIGNTLMPTSCQGKAAAPGPHCLTEQPAGTPR